jgi:hypothetical protein
MMKVTESCGNDSVIVRNISPGWISVDNDCEALKIPQNKQVLEAKS